MDEIANKPRSKKREIEDGQKPVHVIVEGALLASIYLRQAPSGYAYFAYNIKRSYQSLTTRNQIFSTDFFAENQSDLIRVVTQASLWITNESDKARASLQNAA